MKTLKTIKFKDLDFEMDVNVSIEDKTIWMNQKEISELYEKSRSTITFHINNILDKGYKSHDDITDEQQSTQSIGCVENFDIYSDIYWIKGISDKDLKLSKLVGKRERIN